MTTEILYGDREEIWGEWRPDIRSFTEPRGGYKGTLTVYHKTRRVTWIEPLTKAEAQQYLTTGEVL